jgi:hypothetical protein
MKWPQQADRRVTQGLVEGKPAVSREVAGWPMQPDAEPQFLRVSSLHACVYDPTTENAVLFQEIVIVRVPWLRSVNFQKPAKAMLC